MIQTRILYIQIANDDKRLWLIQTRILYIQIANDDKRLWLLQTRILYIQIANDDKRVKPITPVASIFVRNFYKKKFTESQCALCICRICVRIQLQINTVRKISILPDSVERERENHTVNA